MKIYSKFLATVMCFGSFLFAGCSGGDEPTFDCNTSDLEINVIDVDPETCASTGSIEISGFGGTDTYLFALDNGAFQESGSFPTVVSGSHIAKVKDGKGCIVQQNVDLTAPSSTANITNVALQTSGCKTSGGSITITAEGSGALSYSIDNISFVNTTGVFNTLAAGTYSVFVKDAVQCVDSQSSVKITTGVSLTSDIKPIIDANCATSSCHVSGGNAPFSLQTKAQIRANAAQIKSAAVINNTMPANNPGGLPLGDKNLISCWVDDGALDN